MSDGGKFEIVEAKRLRHNQPLLYELALLTNSKCRVFVTASRSGSLPLALRLGHIRDTRHSLDAIIAQNTAKRNLDFGKRAQKSAKLSGGVVRLLLVLRAPWKDNATNFRKCQDFCGDILDIERAI